MHCEAWKDQIRLVVSKILACDHSSRALMPSHTADVHDLLTAPPQEHFPSTLIRWFHLILYLRHWEFCLCHCNLLVHYCHQLSISVEQCETDRGTSLSSPTWTWCTQSRNPQQPHAGFKTWELQAHHDWHHYHLNQLITLIILQLRKCCILCSHSVLCQSHGQS